MKKSVKYFLLLLLLVLLSLGTFELIVTWCRDFSFRNLKSYIENSSGVWIFFAFVCAFMFIYLEGFGLKCTCRFLGHDFGFGRTVLFSATDFYFSALTPSAAGGQPAALVMMISRGIPAAVSAIALLLNLVMYTVAIVVLSLICFALRPRIFIGMDTLPIIFMCVGFVVQIGFIILFLMSIFNEKLVKKLCRFGLKLCVGLRIIKDFDSHYEKLLKTIEQYKDCGILLRKEKKLLWKVFFCNFFQRVAVIMVAVCVFMAVGGAPSEVLSAFSVQTFAVLGSNAAPLPGAVGIVDYIFIDGFRGLIDDPASLGIVSRSISFYLNTAFCGLLMLGSFIKRKITNKEG